MFIDKSTYKTMLSSIGATCKKHTTPTVLRFLLVSIFYKHITPTGVKGGYLKNDRGVLPMIAENDSQLTKCI